MENNNQRKIGAILSYVSIIVSTLVGLLYTPFLVNMLGSSEHGLYSLVSSIIGYLTVLDLGFGNALVVYTAKYNEKKQYDKIDKMYGMFFIVYLIIGIIAGLIGLLLFFNVNYIFGSNMSVLELSKLKTMMIILSFNLAITFIFSIYSSIIIANEKFVFQKIMSIISTLLKPLIMIPLLFLGYKSITMCLIITLVNIVVLLSNYFYCRIKLKTKIKYQGFDKTLFKTLFSYSFFIFLAVIVDKINWNVDQIVLGAFCGSTVVSIYSVASQLNTMFINLSSAVSGVLLPKISKMIANNASNDELTNEMIKVGRIQYYIIFLMASGFTLFGKEFILAWVGPNYIDAYYIGLILIIPLCIPLIQNLGVSIMQAKNMHKFRSILLLIIAILNVILSIPLAINYGGIGSAVGTAISLITGNIIIINIYYQKVVKLDIIKFWKEIFFMTLPNLIPIILIIVLKHYIVLYGYKSLVVYGSIYTIIFILINYFINFNKYEKSLLNKMLIKFHVKRV